MSSTADKVKGLANEAAGNVKQGLGKATGNEKLQAEGKAQEVKGEGQQLKGNAKQAVNDTADAIKGKH
ncbi:CsbD family protein [Methylorubrum sp. POS3]|uniref:CsbD family protein n=1 Tax=Methylorubrum sp. POS3 TaxID=2998492 RepID=UPI00372912A4